MKSFTIMFTFKKCRNIYDCLKPLYLVCKIFCLCPYILTKNGFEKSKVGVAISLFIATMFAVLYIYKVESRVSQVNGDKNKVTATIDNLLLYARAVLFAFIVVMNIKMQELYITTLKKLNNFDKDLKLKLGISIHYCKQRNIITVYLVVVGIIVTALELLNCSIYLREIPVLNFVCWFMCYVPLYTIAMFEVQFLSLVYILRCRFKYLNIFIDNYGRSSILLEENGKLQVSLNETKSLLLDLHVLHAELCAIGRHLNNAFSMQLLGTIGNNFISFTTLAYYCFDEFSRFYLRSTENDFNNIFTTSLWAVSKLLQITVMSAMCSDTTYTANFTGTIIYKLGNKFHSTITKEIEFFGIQMLHWNFKLTANGFFDVDMTLFYNVASAATTYLMILIQLQVAIDIASTSNNFVKS